MENERYKAKSPCHILMTDASYFEEGVNGLEEYDIIDYQPPSEFKLGIRLEKNWDPFTVTPILYMISLYLTPEQYLDRCLNLETAPWYGRLQQIIMVENVRYRIQVDGRQENVETGSEGEWGLYEEYYSYDDGTPKLCAIHIGLGVPNHEAFDGMRKRIYSLFEEVYPLGLVERSGNEKTADTGKCQKTFL